MSDHSPHPGTPQSPTKAIVGAAVAAVSAFVLYWVADGGEFTSTDIREALGSALLASGLLGGSVYGVKNTAKRNQAERVR